MSAPASSSRFAASTLPARATAINGVSPSGFLRFGSAPALSSASMIGAEPMIAASVSADVPNWFLSLTFAPALMSARTSSRSSFAAAYMIAVVPSGPGALTSAPFASSFSAVARSPRSDGIEERALGGCRDECRGNDRHENGRQHDTADAGDPRSRRLTRQRQHANADRDSHAQTSDRMPPLSPSFSTGMLLRSNSVTSRSAKRESCGYFTC